MGLEATMICIDDSDWMRNGDFLPTRMQAQEDAVNVICRWKQRESAENTFGVSTLTNAKVLVTLTNKLGNILTRLHRVEPEGTVDFTVGIRVAHLALRHRKTRVARMRIVAFVGSPISEGPAELKKLAMRLKKENVSIDVVNFGELESNTPKLEAFIQAVNGKDGDGSHLVSVPTSANELSEALMTSPIIGTSGNYGGGSDGGATGGGGGGFDFGVDPSQDPELAMALRVSMEEERSRRQAEQGTTADSAAPAQGSGASEIPEVSQGLGDASVPAPDSAMFGAMTEDEELAMALQMSMEQGQGGAEGGDAALAASLAEALGADGGIEEEMDDDVAESLGDPDILRSVLSSLPGVDMESATIRQVLSETASQHQAKEDEKSKEKEEHDADDSDDDL